MAATGDRLIEDPKGPIASAAGQLGESNVLSGRVWLETGGADGGIVATGPSKNGSDPAASGYTVYASTLTKEGAAANESLRAQFKDDPARLASETKKLLEANPQYILKTVYGKTDKDGYYSLRFGEYTNASQTREDFLNRDHVFLWVENQDGVVQQGYTGFNTPVFQRFDSGGGFRPAAIPAENQTVTSRVEDIGNPRYGKPVNSLYNVNYAIMPYEPAYITTDYNATDNPAAQGDTVTPTLTGNISSLPTQLEWRDKTGKVLKTCEIDPTQSAEDQVKACTFDIPAEAETGDMFSAVLVSGGNDVSGSSVIVLNYVPEYADTTVAAGLTASVTPTFSRGEAANLEAPKGTKFAFDPNFAAPAWLSIDPDTGVITVAPGIDVDPVELDVPVVVTYAKGGVANATAKVKVVASSDSDGDGVPDPVDPQNPQPGEDICPDTPAGAKVDADGCAVAPSVGDVPEVTGKKGEEITPVVVPVDNSGMATDVTCKVVGLPEGLSVVYDEAQGGCVISGVPGEDTVKDQSFTVTVEFNRPDGDKSAGVPVEKDGVVNITLPAIPIDPETPVTDSDGDGVPDPKDPQNPQPGEDLCVDTPAGETVDENGCSLSQLYEPAYPDTEVEAGKEASVTPTFTKKDEEGNVEAPTGTTFAFDPDFEVPDWADIDPNTGVITLKPGVDEAAQTITFPVVVTYPDNGGTDKVNAVISVTAAADSDGDGVPDVNDQCVNTPAGAEVDADGCAVAPTVGDVASIQGQVNTAIEPITVPIENPGMATDLVCSAEGLPAGLEIALNEDGTACVISGTPTEAVTDQPVTVKVGFTPADKDNPNQGPATTDTTATINPEEDSDGDGVPDSEDLCADTPAGAEVDENGCAVAPTVPEAPKIDGEVNKPIDPIEVPINNPGMATDLVCSAEGLPAGLTIELNEDGTACVISGTPTEAIDGEYTIIVDSNKPDGDNGKNEPGKNTGEVVVTDGDDDNDGVPNSEDKCENTPAGAKVDADGCAVAPTVPEAPKIDGEVNKPIDPIEVPINNPGKATDLVCSAEGLPEGLTIELNEDGTACVISGTPKAPIDGDYTITIGGKSPDSGEAVSGSNTGKIKVTETVAEPSKPTDQPVKPGKDGLAKTGVEIAGLAGIAAALMAAGVLLVLRKRREN
ncbi:MAG: Rib/alpha-like domain-containing protein [Gleimia sp.]|jgi:LPXTG-motif cell wall-anchored protein